MIDSVGTAVAALLRAAADQMILPRFGALDSADIHEKSSPSDLVTVADREAELWLTPRLRDVVDCVVVGEEACEANPTLRKEAGSPRAWTVDPVDGTGNFVKGNRNFCCMVALLEAGVPVRSWIWLPLEKTLFYAAASEGALCIRDDGAVEHLSLISQDWQMNMMIGGASAIGMPEPERTAVRARLKTLPGRQFLGSSGVLATLIASGAQQFLMQARCTPWDHAPVDLLCREAGAHAALLNDGSPFNAAENTGFMVAPDKASWAQLRHHIGTV